MLENYRISFVPAEGKITIRHFKGCTKLESLLICENNAQIVVDTIDAHEREVHGYGKKDSKRRTFPE